MAWRRRARAAVLPPPFPNTSHNPTAAFPSVCLRATDADFRAEGLPPGRALRREPNALLLT